MNELSETEKIIQEQAKLIEEEEKGGSGDALSAENKEIIAAAGNLEEIERERMQILRKVLRTPRSYGQV